MKIFRDGRLAVHYGDCLDVMAGMDEGSVDAIVTDPPYHLHSVVKRFGKTSLDATGTNEDRARRRADGLARMARGFMGKAWDGGDVAFRVETWAAALRVLKPGGHLVAFGHPKNFHRLMIAIEDAGFELRDTLMWIYGSGFPKSLDVSKAIDKAAGLEREKIVTGVPVKRMIPGADQNKAGWEKNNGREYVPGIEAPASPEAAEWQGWGTALKPAYEPIILARKPLIGTVAETVLAHGTGALNIDACRVEGAERPLIESDRRLDHNTYGPGLGGSKAVGSTSLGRWPANLVHDGSEEVLAAFPETTSVGHHPASRGKGGIGNDGHTGQTDLIERHDTGSGSAARFFYCAKAGADDRLGSKHPTVKPLALMRWLVRMVTPPGGVILDPFAGTGTTGEAAYREGFDAILVEAEADSLADIERRIALLDASAAERKRAAKTARAPEDSAAEMPLLVEETA